MAILSFIFVFLIPFLVIFYAKRIKVIDWLSPVVVCYLLGIIIGNAFVEFWPSKFVNSLSEVAILLALPILLFSTNFMSWLKLARQTIVSFILVLISVLSMTLISYYLFRGIHPELWKISAMMIGVYTGGTPNLSAIGKALEVSEEIFILVNSIDVVLGGFYLLVVLSVGLKLVGRFLPAFKSTNQIEGTELLPQSWMSFSLLKRIKYTLVLMALAFIGIGVSVGLSFMLTNAMSFIVIIVSLSLFAIILSFSPRVRQFPGSYPVGNYFLLVFCFSIGSMARWEKILANHLWLFGFCALIMFGSIFMHLILCYLFKIDRDTAMITSVAGIFGPPFVPMMSQSLKNPLILVSGITTGLVGYAIGNFLGLGVAYFLK